MIHANTILTHKVITILIGAKVDTTPLAHFSQ